MISSLDNYQNIFFIGIAGSGMSALAQYLAGIGKNVSGSDRFFIPDQPNETRDKLEAENIHCFLQDGSGIIDTTDLVIASTAVEEINVEIQKAKSLNIPILLRSELLTLISNTKRTIAVGGTSGKSTTTAVLFDILDHAGLGPSIISGAGLVRLQKQGKIGNAYVGKGEWLVIEADESDGSIVNYYPEVGLLLNIDKDHKEIEELKNIFQIFKEHTKRLFIVNASNVLTAPFSQNKQQDFSSTEADAGYKATDFEQVDFKIRFKINGVDFSMNAIGRHNMENALAATATANQLGVDLKTCAEAIKNYQGIYRRNQILGQKNGIWVIDDYAHNPAKVAAAIRSVQPLAKKLVAWFQPHGYGPTRFLRNDFVKEISQALRPQDEIWMSEIFYAGGTTTKNISAGDLINDLKTAGSNAYFVENRNDLTKSIKSHCTEHCAILLMGARDPSLDEFAKKFFEEL
ncbi:MAG TPA: Mur ligase domain-containing protein [Chitinophagaceae bacterium]|jgi:UDP-N-acetylmuramate--alanine ligase|nr:Mur ligase domain-containing protein [Chitinophagaceae bacterium]